MSFPKVTQAIMHLEAAHLTFLVVATVVAVYFAYRLRKARNFFRKLQKDGAPMPPHHPLFGHLGLMLDIALSLPRDIMPTVLLADQIRRRYPHLDRAFYLDLWPFTPPMLVIIAPDLMRQATQAETSLPKVAFLKNYLKPISGGHDLVSMEGEEWRRWRDVFRPGFGKVTELVPNLVETICVFRDHLKEQAQKESDDVFQLHHSALLLAMDMSGKAIWDHDLDSQRAPNDMADAIVSQLGWLLVEGFMPFASLNIIRPLVHWYNGCTMERYIGRVLRKKSLQSGKAGESCVIDRAVTRALNRRNEDKDDKKSDPYREFGGEAHFKRVIKSQMRFLLLAGYDTTASTITYVLNMLSQHPQVLARMRQEHNEVLGPELSLAPQRLAAEPHLISRVPYTTAVIKETMRLYPPTSTLRNGIDGFDLYDRESNDTGRVIRYPTKGCIVFGNHHGLHHNPRYWRDPDTFIPERFLVSPNDPSGLYPLQDAWRPFEKGPRVCMGQELAMVEIKAVCMLVVREFDFCPAYDEWDNNATHRKESKIGIGTLLPSASRRHVNGDRVYQTTGGGGSHPADGYPCRVKLVSNCT